MDILLDGILLVPKGRVPTSQLVPQTRCTVYARGQIAPVSFLYWSEDGKVNFSSGETKCLADLKEMVVRHIHWGNSKPHAAAQLLEYSSIRGVEYEETNMCLSSGLRASSHLTERASSPR
jgi:hypothetical protein